MRKLFLSVLTCALTCFIYSQEIASFSSLNNTGCSGVVANDINLTASGICRGSGIDIKTGASTFNSINWSTVFDNTDYLEWTISPNLGYEINLSSMDIAYDRSNNGPTSIDIQIDYGSGFNSIYIDNAVNTTVKNITIDLSSFTNINSTITFRLYGYNAVNGTGTLDIEEHSPTNKGVVIHGTITPLCSTTTTWDGSTWDNGFPNINKATILDGDYDTSTNGSFTACSLTINSGSTLIVSDATFVEVENDVDVNGTISVQTQGNFIQNDPSGAFNLNGSGTASLFKLTATKQAWYYYTFWSSPVTDETIGDAFPNTSSNRRFIYNAANYLDSNGDNVDDNGDDWEVVPSGHTMIPGVGYAATSSTLGLYPSSDSALFEGAFNTGNISTSIHYNVANTLGSWNFLGNPYPGAIDFAAFQAANSSVIDGVAYFWSQASPPSSSNPGNQVENFSQNDYATYTVGTGGAAGASGIIPTQYIPSAQGFFVSSLSNGNVTYTNAMRIANGTSNSQFFKNSNFKTQNNIGANKLWIDLTSNNGVYNQILVGYVDGATSGNDGLSFDAPRLLSSKKGASLYSLIDGTDKKFAIQGKSPNSLDKKEKLRIGFKTNIEVATVYTLSLAKLQGTFLTENAIYLKDKLLNKYHELSSSDYSFTSETGEFNNRFEIVFKTKNSLNSAQASVKIFELENGNITFASRSNLGIKSIEIFDFLNTPLYKLNGPFDSKAFELSKLKKAIYIAKVEFTDGTIVTKKFIKK
ncbi:T9SS type A sorting domain-containing protein [Seonamhaeicola sediminis]|uniref:T9SS type A sorting domain-containing protein n=1 Tax=Seonamhaeicola sediminis TaxID=2528206 RepID=A0A562YGC1_9FLAO|nr:T9SS type A sorting domain-containing protein [Seonamhaeicola sediminis]TWO33862.1 T9SS type A sorting domain-containing protein [Seonamhaeicola sediminis]